MAGPLGLKLAIEPVLLAAVAGPALGPDVPGVVGATPAQRDGVTHGHLGVPGAAQGTLFAPDAQNYIPVEGAWSLGLAGSAGVVSPAPGSLARLGLAVVCIASASLLWVGCPPGCPLSTDPLKVVPAPRCTLSAGLLTVGLVVGCPVSLLTGLAIATELALALLAELRQRLLDTTLRAGLHRRPIVATPDPAFNKALDTNTRPG